MSHKHFAEVIMRKHVYVTCFFLRVRCHMRQHIFSNLLLRSRIFLVAVTCIMHQSPLLMLPLRLTQNCIFFLFSPTIFHFYYQFIHAASFLYSHHPKNMASSTFTKWLYSTLLLLTAFSILCMPKLFPSTMLNQFYIGCSIHVGVRKSCYFSLENHISYNSAFIWRL